MLRLWLRRWIDVNLRELFRRVTFSICVGNSDDHFRSHGFLLAAKGSTLSLAYDIPPTLNDHQSLLINSKTNISSLSILFDSCDEYMITHEVAKGIIDEVIAAVRGGVHNKQTRH